MPELLTAEQVAALKPGDVVNIQNRFHTITGLDGKYIHTSVQGDGYSAKDWPLYPEVFLRGTFDLNARFCEYCGKLNAPENSIRATIWKNGGRYTYDFCKANGNDISCASACQMGAEG